MVVHLLVLAIGVALAAFGGEVFVRGVIGLASWLRVPAGLVGTTVAAFATSAPELSVGISAVRAGRPELALGDALGSNVMNLAFVLGTALVAAPLVANRHRLRRDLLVAFAAPLLTLVALIDGRVVRAEAVVLLAVFGGWLVATGREGWRERSAAERVLGERNGRRVALYCGGGVLALIGAGRVIVHAAQLIGTDLGLDPFAVGAVMVALGTSSPEVATALISVRRGHSEIGIGTALGSNVFNNLWIVGLVALFSPIESDVAEVLTAVAFSLAALALVVPNRHGVVPRHRAVPLLALAALFLAATVTIAQ